MKKHCIAQGVPPMELGRYLRRAYPMLSERVLRDALKHRDVRVNGEKGDSERMVHGGDEITLYILDNQFSESLAYAYNDGKLLIPVKPQGLPVDADQDGIGVDTLLTRLQNTYPNARLCNRLDAQTGGLVVAAADDEVYEAALMAFEEKSLEKAYIALTKGGFPKDKGELHDYLVKDAKNSTVHVVHKAVNGAKPIHTKYRVLRDDGETAAVALCPVTGRTHQLRAHMADFGHPILGDDRYGERNLNRRYTGGLKLWCAGLRFLSSGAMAEYANQTFSSPMPIWAQYESEEVFP